MNFLKVIFNKMLRYIDSIKYWKKQGAIIGENCEIHHRASLGSEPYLVKIGNHVRLCDGVKIITHDGGLWVFRERKELSHIDAFGEVKIGDNVHVGIDVIIARCFYWK